MIQATCVTRRRPARRVNFGRMSAIFRRFAAGFSSLRVAPGMPMNHARVVAQVAAALLALSVGACATRPGGGPASGAGAGIDAAGTVERGAMPGGSVRFEGFGDAALRDFLVVPESGLVLQPARSGLITGVDGFWWRHERGRWFKIPNHCACLIRPDPAGPFASSFRFDSDCDALGSAVQRMRGRPESPGFQPDVGATGHPTDYPFLGSGPDEPALRR